MKNKTYTWIDTTKELDRFVSTIKDVIAVDTERNSTYAYRPMICLIQVATEKETVLIDSITLRKGELRPLLDVFRDPSVVKIIHSAGNDLIAFDQNYQITFSNVFDTQVALNFLNEGCTGLVHLLSSYFGVTTNKKYQQYNWAQRPIASNACEYAAMDVAYLIQARQIQTKRLKENGWYLPCLQQCQYIVESSFYEPTEFNPDGWVYVKGIKSISGKGKRIIRDLYIMRHHFCDKHNVSANIVAPNSALLLVAKKKPVKLRELNEIRGFSQVFLRSCEREILSIVSHALKVEGIGLPKPRYQNQNRDEFTQNNIELDEEFFELYERDKELFVRLKKWRNEKAGLLHIPVHYISTNRTLWAVVRSHPKNLDDLRENSSLLPWQCERFGEEILSLLIP